MNNDSDYFGCRLSATIGTITHESAFLFQRLSIALQQYNESVHSWHIRCRARQ